MLNDHYESYKITLASISDNDDARNEKKIKKFRLKNIFLKTKTKNLSFYVE